jgi:hypothetical protein
MPFLGVVPQSFPHFATGPTLVQFHGYNLGYSEDRVQIDETPFFHEVKSDGFGGSEGPPCDVQYLGSLVYVRCALNRFNQTTLKTISSIATEDARITAPGIMPRAGWYMRQDDGMEELVLSSKEYIVTFSKAVLRQGRKWSMGTRHQAFILMFECHIDDPCDCKILEYGTGEDPCDPAYPYPWTEPHHVFYSVTHPRT